MKHFYETEDGVSLVVKTTADKIKVCTASLFRENIKSLITLKDSGNGYFVKCHSYRSTEADNVFNLSYSDMEYLYYAYKAILDDGE